MDSTTNRTRTTQYVQWNCRNGVCYGLNSDGSNTRIDNPVHECQVLARQTGGISRFEIKDARKLDSRELVGCNSGIRRANGRTQFYYQALSKKGIVGDQTVIDDQNGVSWRCLNGEFCWAALDTASDDMRYCKGFAEKVGGVEYFWGHEDRKLTGSKLNQCNSGADGYYYYVAVATRRFESTKTFTINNITRTCVENTTRCTWRSKDSTPSVEGCRKMRKKVGTLRGYGYEGKMLSSEKIRQCNKT